MYKKYLDILDLVLEMQASIDGVSYKYIEKKYSVSRRTAERMIKAILDSDFGSDVQVITKRPKTWRIVSGIIPPGLNYQQVSVLNSASKVFREMGMDTYSAEVENLSKHLRAGMTRQQLGKIDVDVDVLNESEAFVFRPGPVEQIEAKTLNLLRYAMLANHKVRFDYTTRKNHQFNLTVHPYGFLTKQRQYLIGFNPQEEIKDFRTYSIKQMTNLEILENEPFLRDKEFSVKEYLRDSFGIYHERRTYNILWRFDKSVADVVSAWNFHHTQKMHHREDGRLDVSFKAGGLQEMAWHLMTWGKLVEVIKPKKLIKTLESTVESVIQGSNLFSDKDSSHESNLNPKSNSNQKDASNSEL